MPPIRSRVDYLTARGVQAEPSARVRISIARPRLLTSTAGSLCRTVGAQFRGATTCGAALVRCTWYEAGS